MRLIHRSSVALMLIPGGLPEPNTHGVYADHAAEVYEWRNPSRHREFCQIRILRIAEGWIIATRARPPSGTAWADPLVARWIYYSPEDAIAGAVIRVREKLKPLETWCFGGGALEAWLSAVEAWLNGLSAPHVSVRFS